ncbi:hypothetical protein DPMN_096999 [Dreissena polymorpha]|uniref:Uncharacterized protein n=1 Tax=Dreissena polymorpha TaxID=45954 RepID=A0A9D4R508_DREPO|nr:hypothetical protein DPMN_096999 [Dreissena polymorpha]
MLEGMKIPPLQERRKANRLIFYKVVEGLVPALQSSDYLTPVRKSKRKVTPKSFQNYNSDNIIEKYSKVLRSNTVQDVSLKQLLLSKDNYRVEQTRG